MELKPIYQADEINKPILISEEPVIFKTQNGEFRESAQIFLDHFPKSRIKFHVAFKGQMMPLSLDNIDSVVLPEKNNLELKGFAHEMTHSTNEGTSLIWSPKNEPVKARGNDETEISYAIFHLFNFKESFGSRYSDESLGNTSYRISHFDLCWDDWIIEIKSLTSTSKTFKSLRKEGGYGLTHVASVSKKENAIFKGKELENILYGLRFFLSFAKGAWCAPILCTGFDNNDAKVWEFWNSPHSPWQNPMSWNDCFHGKQLTDLFPDFMNKWFDENWKYAVKEAIYWYLSANDQSDTIQTDSAIILSQTALERLSYEYAVNHKRLLTGNGFKDLWASDKLRLLFSSIGIPIDVPDSLKNLEAMALEMKWLDATHALTEIRNSIIHPDHKHKGKFENVDFEAWGLSLWFLELSILRICGYDGKYSNRLVAKNAGEVENVPWKYNKGDVYGQE